MPGRASGVKMVGMAEMRAAISLEGVAVHPDCLCVCLCYFHFAPENPEDGEMYLLVPAHHVVPDKFQRAVKWLCVCVALQKCPMTFFFLGITGMVADFSGL